MYPAKSSDFPPTKKFHQISASPCRTKQTSRSTQAPAPASLSLLDMFSSIKPRVSQVSRVQTRLVSSFTKKKDVRAPFPTTFHPVRSANKTKILLPEGVVHNPPSSVPTPHQTPAAFLPESDPRKTAVWNTVKHNTEYMPPLTEPAQKQYNVSPEDIAEIQRLRFEEPEVWTRKALAKKFNCSPFFISLVSKPTPERQAEMDRRLGVIKSQWTERRALARRDRARRHAIWLSDA